MTHSGSIVYDRCSCFDLTIDPVHVYLVFLLSFGMLRCPFSNGKMHSPTPLVDRGCGSVGPTFSGFETIL